MKKWLICLFVATALLAGCSNSSKDNNWTVTYDVVGTENNQLWDLKSEDFLTLINEQVSDEMQLDYLKEYDPDSMSCMLSKNGETWKILLDVFPAGEVDSLTFKKYDEVSDWVNNIGKVELSLFADDEESAKENGIYVRTLISIFTPGAESLVEDAIGLYGEPEKDAVISEGVRRVSLDSVAYTYFVDKGRFLVQPHLEPWPEADSSPSVIRPS